MLIYLEIYLRYLHYLSQKSAQNSKVKRGRVMGIPSPYFHLLFLLREHWEWRMRAGSAWGVCQSLVARVSRGMACRH